MADHFNVLDQSVTASGIGAIPASLVDAKGDLLAATAADTLARVPLGTGTQLPFVDSSQAAGVRWGHVPLIIPYRSGEYYFTTPGGTGIGTSATTGTGTLRVHPWWVPNDITITRLGAEITSAGEAGSLYRLGIYSDNGAGYPGALLLDAGTILGDSATVQEKTVSQAIAAGLYWAGGVVQNVVTTQPTVRVMSLGLLTGLSLGTSIPGVSGSSAAYVNTSVTGALPASFTATVAGSGNSPRVFFKVA